jgi:2-alkyl-3-oxoalkanoate reductase
MYKPVCTIKKRENRHAAVRAEYCHEYEQSVLRVGVIGCGRVAEHHLRFITETDMAMIVGLADVNEANARRLGERYGVKHIYGSLEGLLHAIPLDVLHVVTPPAYHYDQAIAAIDHGVHVLIEKPCTLRACETEDLYCRAAAKGTLICPDFIQLFHPAFQRALSIIGSGQLGCVVHIESHLSLDLNTPELREATGLHWSYKLPGGILHNYITHPLYLTLFWTGEPKQITVSGRSYGTLPQGLTDHLDIMLEGNSCTAYVVLSLAIKSPPYYYVQVFCEKGVVLVNFDTSTLLVTRHSALPRTLNRATSNFRQTYQLSVGATRNIVDFMRGKLVPYQGLQMLIPQFYASVKGLNGLPISQDLAIAVVKTEEAVFARAGKLHLDACSRPSKQLNIKHPEKILVTGATGYVGSQVVRKLIEEGYYVRAFVRELSHVKLLEQLGVELLYGDVRDLNSLSKAAEGMDIVVHLAAALRGTPGFVESCCVEGTKNVAEAAQIKGVKRVIYMSSMSVYDYLKLHDGDTITEQSPLEEFPELRGTYSLAKRRAEDVALSHLGNRSPTWTILRPSVIVGEGQDIFLPAGIKIGNILVCLSAARKHLRLIHVRDVAAAIIQLIQNKDTHGRVFTLSHPDPLTLRDYVDGYIRANHYRNIRVLYIPYGLAWLGVRAIMTLRKLTGKGPRINIRRLAYLYRDVRVSSSAIKNLTGGQVYEGLLEQLKKEVDWRAGSVQPDFLSEPQLKASARGA